MKLVTSRLTIRHLRMVVAIVEEGNLVRAAKRLNMTQSAVTKALQEVEALTKARLFDRNNRGVVPTMFGETLAEHARLVITQLAHAEEHLADLRDGTGGRVAIGTLLSAAAELLPTAIARLRKDRPKLVVKIVEGTNDVLIPALRAGELDMVVGRLSELRDRLNVVQEVLMDDIACVVARRGHPLAERHDLGLADLIGWEWILPPQETSLRRQIDIAFREEGLEPPVHAVELRLPAHQPRPARRRRLSWRLPGPGRAQGGRRGRDHHTARHAARDSHTDRDHHAHQRQALSGSRIAGTNAEENGPGSDGLILGYRNHCYSLPS
ncbi:LysR family transcriptional regulator [Mesorhizobium sp. UC74_2]|uniref:LysR family transcriptional regulator n=1 Tax=Mesorhizobium sp. UC74_2 TaxID=3350171 RepID=UPI00366B29CA